MNRILAKKQLGPEVFQLEVEAPRIQKRWKAGQFIILRPNSESERIPLTLVQSNAERQSITIVIQAIGNTTKETVEKEPGEFLADVVGAVGRTRVDVRGASAWWSWPAVSAWPKSCL